MKPKEFKTLCGYHGYCGNWSYNVSPSDRSQKLSIRTRHRSLSYNSGYNQAQSMGDNSATITQLADFFVEDNKLS